jgi:hypothetical protein
MGGAFGMNGVGKSEGKTSPGGITRNWIVDGAVWNEDAWLRARTSGTSGIWLRILAFLNMLYYSRLAEQV